MLLADAIDALADAARDGLSRPVADVGGLACPAAEPIGPRQLVARDTSWDYRKRMHLKTSQIAGKCLSMELVTFSTPGITVYSADYFHSGNTVWH